MKKSLGFVVVLLLGISIVSRAQDIPIQVINSAGGSGTVNTTSGVIDVSYNIGETVISTITGTPLVTQGFLQPDIIGKFGLTATAMNNPSVSCAGKKDGFIVVTSSVSGTYPQTAYAFTYIWEPSTICPSGNSCNSVYNLPPGIYSVTVISQYTGSALVPNDTVRIQNIVISDSQGPCDIEIFNGITPNGDGNNDFFFIKNIDGFPKNTVDIYNRWGQQLAHIEGYDNADKKWKGTFGNGETPAPTGTYFYIIDLGNGTSPYKGWIELLRK